MTRTESLARAFAAAVWSRVGDMAPDALEVHAGAPATTCMPAGDRVDVAVTVKHEAGGRGTVAITVFAGYVVLAPVDLPPALTTAAIEAARRLAVALDLLPQGDRVWRDAGVCPDIAAAFAEHAATDID